MSVPKPTPGNVLIDLVSGLLVPTFLAASNGDIQLAQLAAIQTMSAYHVQHQADTVTIAQILAFGLATLGSLSLSMDDTLSLSMVLRLRGNANACNRSAEQLRRALRVSHQETQLAPPTAAEPPETQPAATAHASKPQPPTQPAATPVPVQPPPSAPAMPITADQQRRAAWASAFTEVAAECTAEIPHLPPAQQKVASIRAAALNSSATSLLCGVDLAPFALNRLGPSKPPKNG